MYITKMKRVSERKRRYTKLVFRRRRVGQRALTKLHYVDENRKRDFDDMVNGYFCDEDDQDTGKIPLVNGGRVVPYAVERLRKLNQEQACQSMTFDGKTYTETSSKNPDVVLRIDEGPVAPLGNETVPDQFVGAVHNYVIVLVPNPLTGKLESKIEFLRMNLVEVRSKHAHIILSKIDPGRRGNFLYMASGECVYDGKKMLVNIQSGMNWEINLSRPGIYERVQGVRKNMTSFKTIFEGVGPKNDFWGAVAYTFFRDVLGYSSIEYGTSTLRKKTSESLENIQETWCGNGVGVEVYGTKDQCLSRDEGINLCKKDRKKSSYDNNDFRGMTVTELRGVLYEMGIEVEKRTRRQRMIDMIEEILN